MKRKPKSLRTPRFQIRSALRMLWLHSRERSAALKAAGYCCEECGVKQSKAKGRECKVEVHHRNEILDWDLMIDYIQRHLLCDPDALMVLCESCHDKQHQQPNEEKGEKK